ncbi:MAG: TonB-dependent receptor plug domain-containing protein, partial [Flavobacteriaceae bacterium]|nr:TonB-dependent receptor plug domain-containing protein [Flavobacteriaceae bacterium]
GALAPVEKVLDENNTVNVFIKSGGIELDQVVVTEDKKRDPEKKAIVGGVIADKRMQGFATSKIGEEDINTIQSNVSDATEGKFSGVSRGTGQDLSQSVVRGTNSIFGNNYALIIIDGAPVARSNSGGRVTGGLQLTDFIDPNNIAEVEVLKGYAATNRYGSEGSGGVILITTKLAASRAAADETDDGKLKDNIYDGKVLPSSQTFETAYLTQLKTQNTVQEAYDLYLEQRERFWGDEAYLIDVSDYFRKTNNSLANQIAYNLIERDESTVASLRGLYLKAMAQGNYSLALDAANAQFEKFPQRTQSYLDLALAYVANGDFQLGLDILAGIENGSINPNLDFSALQKIADNEIRHLVGKHKAKLDLSKLKVQHLTAPALDARIIFDWSNTDGEFELQFVNPSKRFFTWEHNSKDEKRIQDELLNGYNQEEFEIDGGDKGQWLINVKYLGNRTKGNTAPTFLKCTVYYNYGKPNERLEQKVIRLHQIGREELAVRVLTQ